MLKKSRLKSAKDTLMPTHVSSKTSTSQESKRRTLLNNPFKIISSKIYPNRKLYFIGNNFPGVYFTSREADCMALLLRGKSVKNAAIVLGLSVRTLEYYVKSMRIKLGCSNKYQLVETVYTTDFTQDAEKLYAQLMLAYSKRQKTTKIS